MTTIVYVPRETAAISVGANAVVAKLEALGVDVHRNGSRGMSWLEPLVEVVTPDGRIAFGPVSTDDVDELVAANFRLDPSHELNLGPTESLEYFAAQERFTFRRCGVIEPTLVEEYRRHGGFAGLERALSMTPQAIVDEVKKSRLRGRGGAGFPTGIKWQTVANTTAEQKYIVCNADEGDSGTFSDRLMMEGDPFALLEGMAIAGRAVGADRGFIYLRSEYPLCATVLDEALTAARESNWLGDPIQGSDFSFDIELRIGAGSYVCGEETAMLESLEGRRGQIRYKPPLPAVEGLWGQPSVINNVITLATVPGILADGGEAYAAMGDADSRGTLPFQLAGNIRRGGLVEVPFGLTLRTLIEDFGGGTASGRPARAVQVGGPLGAYFPESLFDTPLDYEAFAAQGGTVGHGGIVVFDDTVDMAEQARFAMEFCVIESCGKCTPCRIGSVRGVELMDKIMATQDPGESIDLLLELCDTMTDASLCAMGTMTPNPVRSAIKYFHEDFDRA